MQQRGRKASAALEATSPVTVQDRPSAPLDLTAEQGDEWQKIVDGLPADWFAPENEPVLKQYVRHIIEARRLAQLIDQECAKPDCDVSLYATLLKQQREESGKIASLATKMRLTQQSRYGTRAADTASKKRTVSRPWESD